MTTTPMTATPRRWSPAPGFWAHRPVAVTGGTGFVGSHLVAALVDLGADVVVLRRDRRADVPLVASWIDRVTVVDGDLAYQARLERLLGDYEVATVFHLAAQSQVGVANRNPAETFDANVTGTWRLLEAVRRSPAVGQVVVASSDKAYGSQPVLPYTEDMPLSARHPYDVSKACADMIAASYATSFAVPVAITRCGNFFGPGDLNWQRLVPSVVRSLAEGRAPVIRSSGAPTRDYLYVRDGVFAYLQLAEALAADAGLAGQAFNFSMERPLTVLDLVGLLAAAVGSDIAPEVSDVASHEIDHQALSAEKARTVLGWAPQLTMEEALAETVQWYLHYLGDARRTGTQP